MGIYIIAIAAKKYIEMVSDTVSRKANPSQT
jgi:hypothetical protein